MIMVIFAGIVAFCLLCFFIWIVTIKSIVQNDFLENWERLAWVLGVVFFPFFGVLCYHIAVPKTPRLQVVCREDEFV